MWVKCVLLLSGILLFCGCTSRNVLTKEQSANFGFYVNGSSVLASPQSNIARIYIMRPNISFGAKISYTLAMEYDATLNEGGSVVYDNHADALGFLVRGSIFYVDVLPNKPIAIAARTTGSSYVVFTPEASKVYCLVGAVTDGFPLPQPNIKLVGRATCEELYSNLAYNIEATKEYQRKWRQSYLSKQNTRSMLDGRVFWLSYLMD